MRLSRLALMKPKSGHSREDDEVGAVIVRDNVAS